MHGTAPTSGYGVYTDQTGGELSRDTRVSAYLPFINGFIASIPEPATWALYLIGFGLVGATQHCRRAVSVAA